MVDRRSPRHVTWASLVGELPLWMRGQHQHSHAWYTVLSFKTSGVHAGLHAASEIFGESHRAVIEGVACSVLGDLSDKGCIFQGCFLSKGL